MYASAEAGGGRMHPDLSEMFYAAAIQLYIIAHWYALTVKGTHVRHENGTSHSRLIAVKQSPGNILDQPLSKAFIILRTIE